MKIDLKIMDNNMKYVFGLFIFLMFITVAGAQDNSKTAAITGKVTDQMTKKTLPGITVTIEGTETGTFTDINGQFKIEGIKSGTYTLKFTGIGYNAYIKADVLVTYAKPVEIEVELAAKSVELDGVVVQGSYFNTNYESITSTQVLNGDEIRRTPGAQEDVIRATALLPGVAVTSAGRNDLLVRGGAPFENLFIVDNIEIPNINHFGSQGATGGPLSLINIDFVKDVEFSSGGFGAKYGDKVSSITNITLRKGNTQRFSGEANLSATGFGLLAEGPIGEKGSYLLNARRSYLDFIFKAAGFGFIPQYWDFSGKFNYSIDNDNELSFLTIGALDDVALNNDDLDKRYTNSRVAIPEQNQYFSGLTWKRIFDKGFATLTLGRSFSYFNTAQSDSLLNTVFKNESYEGTTSLALNADFQLSDRMNLMFGNTVKYASLLDYDILIPDSMRTDENGTGRELHVDTNFSAVTNSTYASLTTAVSQFKFTAGARLDYYGFMDDKLFISPRASAVFYVNEVSSLLFSTGLYYQSPSFIWLVGDPDQNLKPIRAEQYVLGYEHTPLKDVKVQLEVFYKKYSNYPARVFRPQAVLAPAGFEDISSDIPYGLEKLSSEAEGYSYGAELFIQKKMSEIPLYGLFSFTYSQAKFKGLDGIERYGAYDTRIIMNLSAGYRPWENWEFAMKFRIATGLPTTPYLSDYSGRLDYTQYNDGERLPLFHQLDFRVDKRWELGSYYMITYIDIQNIYNRKNVSGVRWDYRDMQEEYRESFGVLPSIGVTFYF